VRRRHSYVTARAADFSSAWALRAVGTGSPADGTSPRARLRFAEPKVLPIAAGATIVIAADPQASALSYKLNGSSRAELLVNAAVTTRANAARPGNAALRSPAGRSATPSRARAGRSLSGPPSGGSATCIPASHISGVAGEQLRITCAYPVRRAQRSSCGVRRRARRGRS
jgi:hypothetical protein